MKKHGSGVTRQLDGTGTYQDRSFRRSWILRVADNPFSVMSHTVHAFQAIFDLCFAVDRLNQSLDVSITKCKSLETTWIVRVTGHVIRTN